MSELLKELNQMSLSAVADVADNEGVWMPGYIGKYHSGYADLIGDVEGAMTFNGLTRLDTIDILSSEPFAQNTEGLLDYEEYCEEYIEGRKAATKVVLEFLRSKDE